MGLGFDNKLNLIIVRWEKVIINRSFSSQAECFSAQIEQILFAVYQVFLEAELSCAEVDVLLWLSSDPDPDWQSWANYIPGTELICSEHIFPQLSLSGTSYDNQHP